MDKMFINFIIIIFIYLLFILFFIILFIYYFINFIIWFIFIFFYYFLYYYFYIDIIIYILFYIILLVVSQCFDPRPRLEIVEVLVTSYFLFLPLLLLLIRQLCLELFFAWSLNFLLGVWTFCLEFELFARSLNFLLRTFWTFCLELFAWNFNLFYFFLLSVWAVRGAGPDFQRGEQPPQPAGAADAGGHRQARTDGPQQRQAPAKGHRKARQQPSGERERDIKMKNMKKYDKNAMKKIW